MNPAHSLIQPTDAFASLPKELLLYIFKEFLDLADLWRLLQVSRSIRYFALHTIQRRWKIEISPELAMKVQCRGALIALETLSRQLSMQTRVTPSSYHSTNYLPANPAAAGSVAAAVDLHQQYQHQHQQRGRPTSVYSLEPTERLLLDDEDEDDEIGIGTSGSNVTSPDDLQVNHFLLNSLSYDNNKLFQQLMRREERLHQRIVSGISSYKHKYVLIEDIDIRNRIRSAVDVIFHHAVFVAAISRTPVRLACTHACSSNRTLAAMMVRLLTRLDVAFPACCREITFTLADNIKAFLEYTGYKLLAIAGKQNGRDLCSMVFGPACQSSVLCCEPPPLSTQTPSCRNLLLTLHSISACFDLMGAAFIGKILSESHVECAVQRTCELLSEEYLRPVKRALLVDLLEGWLAIKRGAVASELCRWVRSEIEKCDQQQQPPSPSLSLPSL